MTLNESDTAGSHNRFNGVSIAQPDEIGPPRLGVATNKCIEREPELQQEQQHQLKYWMEHLISSRPAEFICDMPRPNILSGQVDQESLQIKGPLYDKIHQYCESRGVTAFVVLLAAFRAAHYRLTGAEDATIGVPNESHWIEESRNVADVLNKFQCFRLIIDNETFEDLVDQIEATAATMKANRDVSVEKLAALLDHGRDFSLQPLIRVAFSFHSQDIHPPKTSMNYDTDLSFQIFDTHNTLKCCIAFSKDLYEKRTVNNILTIFQKVLEGGLHEPTASIKTINLLKSENFNTLDKMGLLRVERTDYPRELSVVDVFQQQVTATPTRTAIKDRSGSVTYTQLDERSNKIASWLLGQSLAPETLIGVLSSRCSETVIAFMGILKANLAYLPLDTKTPDYRMKAIISCIMGRKIILLGPETEAPADPGEIEYVRISQVLDGASKNNDISSEPIGHISPSATSLAHVLFTSGSTGQPKGVMINHRGIVRLVKQSGIMTYVPPGGVTAHISNIAFDAATWEIYSAILNGGKLVCIDEMTVLDYASMSEICIRENVQTALFTTAVFKEYARNAPELMASLSAVFVGGERLDPNDLPPSLRAIAGKIIHLYGPTENTTVSTMYCLQRAEYCSNGVPIGRAVSNSGAVVMDSKQCLVPLGVIGELVVFGDGLARGYLNPQLDEGRFVLIQIGDESVRGYRTGDHVRQRLDGQLEFLGRIDGQVKIRGQRVELGEVECALRSHKLVHDAIAVLHYGDTDGNSDDARIAGFVTTSAELEDEAQNGDESQIVSMWKDRYDADSYTGFNDIRPEAYGRDFTGWTSMFDGKDIDKAEMNEWLDDTIATILSGGPPGHVLEVGSGSGMILLNILDGLQSYVGLDPSERANNLIGKMSKSLPELNNKVTMYKATAADVCRLEKAAAPPDLVILNSVAQHFPSQEYLYQFVEDLLQLGTEMTLFFGDIRSYALHKDFLAARALRMAGDEVKLDTIRRMVADMERIESELLVDPAFFTGLVSRLPDRIEHVEIIPKKMRATNELSCYRYTAVVHVKAGGHQASATAIKKQIRHIPQSDWIDFVERGLDRGSLLHLIRASLDSSTSALAISNIPYTKTILERHMVESIRTEKSNDFDGNWVSHMRQRAESCAHLSVTDLHALAEEAGYSVEISWARQYSQRGGLDAVFHQYASDKRKGRILFDFPTDYQNRPYASLSSHPLKHQIRQKTQEQLYELAKTQLPQYMIPQSITILDSMPVNENGKIDRRALVNMIESRITERASIQQPTSEVGRQMQMIWANVLHMEPETIGINDSFFNLGGNSISAMKVVAATRKIGWKLSVADIFRSPTLSDVSMVACMSTSITTRIPSIPKKVHFRGPLQLDALASALLALEQRHETLRTTFDTIEGENVQKVHPFIPNKLRIQNITADKPNSLAEALHKEHTTPFDLRKDPGWRVSVFKMGDEHHVLSIVMHHIICDGWSLDVLRKELAILYSAALHGKDPLSAIEPLAVQYSDHALWQRQQDQIDEHNRQLEYWVTQLETSRPAELLCDKLRPSTISGRAGLHELRIEGTIYKNLQEFCRKYQVTPFMVLFAVFRAAHYRLTGVEDATIGTANACRDHWELKDMIGLFVNMQCIRTKVENTTTLEGLIREVQAMVTASFAHQDVPFESIVSALRKERDLSRSPLVQIVFALHSQLNLAEFALEDIETELMTPPMGSRFDLEFHLYQEKHGLKGQIMFSTDLFNLNTIDNLKSVFLRILKQGLASPSAAIESLPLMTKEEYAKLNSMKLLEMETTDYPRNYSIIEVFQQQVSATPDKVAVRDGPTSLTYSQLDDKSNRLAQWLHKRSFASESLVGVLASRSHLTIIAYLGVLKACLAYLPLDPTSPLGRTEAILSSVKDCKLILVGPDAENYAKLLDSVDSESITSILECPADSNGCILKPLNNIFPSPNNLAYVMFTSGSTGRPKGVMIQHRGILRLVENKNIVQNMPGAVNTAHLGNVTFDASTWEIYPTLLNGGTLICFSSMELLDYKTLPKAFADESVQAMFITPALLRQYLAHCPDLFRGIHILYIGGDRLDPEDAFATLRVTTGKVINAYGPTENTCISTYFHVSSPNPENCVNGVPIGRVFPNSGAFVMDSRQQLVPLGVVGELVVTGDGLARGYTDPNYDLNRFISITIAGNEMRAYRTGDYVRYRPEDGQLDFFGRMDNQIKIRGQRLELGEIEHAMLSHKAVNEAAVVIRQSGEAGQEATIDGFITLSEQDHALDVLLDDEQEYQQVQASDVKSNIQAHGSFDEVQLEAVGQDVLGWTSMLDGGKIDKNELNEWLDDTMHTMLNGGSPKEVLEIGTGSGMILFNLPSSLQKYVGLEPSERNIEVIKKMVESNPSLNSKIRMYQAPAKDLNQLHLLISPDLVILNSIVQYFPSQDYLFRVIEDLVKLDGKAKTLFFGDVRSYALHREFLAARALQISSKYAHVSLEGFQHIMDDLERAESELLIDPGFFTGLSDHLPDHIEHVEIIPKMMSATNELSSYRYTAIVHVKAQHPPSTANSQHIHDIEKDDWINFEEQGLNYHTLVQMLNNPSNANGIAAVSNISNAKMILERSIIDEFNARNAAFDSTDWIAIARQKAENYASLAAIDIMALAEETGYQVEISWARQFSQRGGFDAVFHRHQKIDGSRTLFNFPTDHSNRLPHTLSSHPLRQKLRLQAQEQVLEMLRLQLPSYMVPRTITVLDKMPINSSGKLDRQALAKQRVNGKLRRPVEQQPTTEVQRQLQSIWAKVLVIDPSTVGLDDNFFLLGGSSIAAMRVAAEIRKAGYHVTVADIFRHPALRDLSSQTHPMATNVTEEFAPFSLLGDGFNKMEFLQELSHLYGIDPALVCDAYQSTSLQEGLLSLTSKQNTDYVLRAVFRLSSSIDAQKLRNAWETIFYSLPILRTRIIQHRTLGTVQIVMHEKIQWDSASNIDEYLKTDSKLQMGPGQPLTRYAFIQDNSGLDRWLVWTVHHSLYDGWSLPLILDSVRKAYQGSKINPGPQYQAFIKYIKNQDDIQATRYWKEMLDGSGCVSFPTLPPSIDQPTADGSVTHCISQPGQRRSGITKANLVRASWALVVGRMTAAEEVTFGATVSGRNAPVDDIDLMMAPTFATVPVRIKLAQAHSVGDYLTMVQEQATEMIPYEQMGLQRIASVSPEARNACRFQTLLVVQSQHADDISMQDGIELDQDYTQGRPADTYGLVLEINIMEHIIKVSATFDSRMIEPWMVKKLLERLDNVINQLDQASPEQPLSQVVIMTSQDINQIWEWNRNVPLPINQCPHELIEERSKTYPASMAVCAWDGELTYGELMRLADHLAQYLTSLQPNNGTIIPICFEKSMWTIVAIFAVLKSGAGFVLLDPSLPEQRRRDVEQWWGKSRIINLYGPSECTPVTVVNNSPASLEAACNIGTGVGSVTWVVDQDDHNILVAPGCVGELVIEGPLVGPGYLNNPEKTATAFIKDPLWLLRGAPGQTGRSGQVYKTGDLVSYNIDGSLRYVARKDLQRKIRGQRIEIGEIEHQLESLLIHDGQIVADIIEPQGGNSNQMLAVFIKKTNAPGPNRGSLQDAGVSVSAMPSYVTRKLSERLPHYMVPTVLFTLQDMPRSISGKIDRQQIHRIGASFTTQQLAEMQTAMNGPKKPARSQKERQIQEIWASILEIDPESIGLDDSFVHLGGNSIIAMKISAEARKYGIRLGVADIFGRQTLRDIVEQASVLKSCEDAIPCLQQSGPVEQSFAQERLWFLDQLHSNLQWYMMPLVFRLRGPLQYNALEAALQAIEQRHDTLRTTFESKDGINMQVVHAFQPRELKVTEIPSSNQSHFIQLLELEQARPFDLGTEPGWRVTLFRLSDNDHILSIIMHHIVSDGWSVDILQKELAVFYSAALRGDEDPTSLVDPLPIQYADYSIWQKQQDQVDNHLHQLNFWTEHLQSSNPAELLCDKPRPPSLSGAADICHLRIDGALYHDLQIFSKLHGVTPFAVLLAAFRITHYRLTGATDATIGIPNANRDRWELRNLIGFFVNMQCIRTVVNEQSFETFIGQVHDEMLLSFTNQDVPFERVVASLEKDRDLSRHPLVQIVFALHSQRDLGKLKLESIDAEPINPSTTSRFDLEFHFFQEDEALQGEVIFSTDLYYNDTISNMMAIFRTTLELGITYPTMAIDSLPLLRDDDLFTMRQLGLSQIQPTDYQRDSSIIDVFSQQVIKQANKVAVKDSTSQMTYTELDEKSTMLANWLARRALAPEILIGVLANRSCLTIVAFLAIIRANLAYLPLDTRTPVGRMETILSSIPGRRLVLLGPGVARPTLSLPSAEIEFASIEEIIGEMTVNLENNFTLASQPNAKSLAYVMFTSGSTGMPKGVMIEHRNILRTAEISTTMQHLLPELVIAHASNIAFDASTWEIYTALLNGGTLICLSHTTLLDYRILRTAIEEEHIQALFITPALLKQHLLHRPLPIGGVEVLYVGGDRLDPHDIAIVRDQTKTKIVNGYGPTENTSFSTLYEITDHEPMTNGVPIGRPLRNSGAFVVDSQQRLVPLGVVGELLVTGDGLARGYVDSRQNLGRFVSFKVNGEMTRGYLTGDYARYRSDGQLEYVGRKDGQVKIRGQRVELGEIEHALKSHKSVHDAVAIIVQQDGDTNEPQIAGYVTLHDDDNEKSVDDEQEYEQVKEWEDRFDIETYGSLDNLHPEQLGRDFVGWTSMYDGENIDKGDMNEWLDDTIEAILGSNPAEHVLEIGSGSGMIMFNLKDALKSYVGLDPSERAVNLISRNLKILPALKEKTKIYKATATDLNRLEAITSSEFAVLNSVVQYFPSQDYLFRVIQALVNLGGIKTIFLGDIRSYALHKDFLTSRALHLLGDHATAREVTRVISDMERAESELLVDPSYFTSLPSRIPGITHVEILPKRMYATNELSSYRYAAVIHLVLESEREVVVIEGDKWIDFEEQGLNAEALKKLLQNPLTPSIVPVGNIPNAKTILERHIVASLSDQNRNETSSWLSTARKTAAACSSLSAIDLDSIAHDSGYQVEISWARQHSQRGGLDAVFHRSKSAESKAKSKPRRLFQFPTDHLDRSYHTFTSHPLQHHLRQKIKHEIKDIVQSQLPQYMVPHFIAVIDQIPINENGKVDRRCLVQSMPIQKPRAIVQPTTDNEREMQRIWADVLNIAPESIGINDSFFYQGGSSIAAMKVVAAAHRAGYELAVADIFRTPKLGELVACSFQRITKVTETIQPFELFKNVDITSLIRDVSTQCQLQPAKIIDAYPCTPLQEGLLALTSKRQGDYVMRAVFDIQPGVTVEKLRQAWETVFKALPLLRTRIVQHVDLGIIQTVIDESISWVEAIGLDEYLEAVEKIPMGIGQPLTAFAVVSNTAGTPSWLVCSMHHALYDGWSLSLIMDAVSKVYQDEQIDQGSQFQAFIKFIKEQDENQTMDYWKTSLEGYDSVPFPYLPPSVTEPRTDTFLEYTIPRPQSQSDITPSSLIRAAWALVVGRMTNTKDVVFGATVSGRNAPVSNIDRMAAPTFATVPVRIKYSATQKISAYLMAVQQQATDMIPFEQIGLPRISHSSQAAKLACGFQTILVIQPEEINDIPDILGMNRRDDSYNTQLSDPYGIILQLQLSQKGILASVGFDSRVMEPWIVDRLLGQLQSVLHQLDCASPNQTLSEVNLATPEDLEQIWKWNATVPSPVDWCVQDVIEDRIIQSPAAEAICAWDGTLTYGELSRLSTELAVHLISLEVGPNMTIPLLFEKSMWTTVAILGVLKTGAAFTLLDQAHPLERLRAILSKVTTKLILSSKVLQGLSSKLASRTIAIDSELFANLPKQSYILPPSPPLSSPMYVVFTSGSTGTPKGVITSHGAFSSAVHYQSSAMGYNSSVRAYDFSGYAFDASIGITFMTLASGGCLCVPSDADRKNNLTSSLVATKANHVDLTPSVSRTLQRERLVDLKVLVIGGEAATQGDFQGWPNGVSVINAYGPSECTPTSTIQHCSRVKTNPSNIGFGVGTVTWITDPDNSQRLSPIGAIGELVLEGPLVGLGYLGEPEKTDSVFINNPTWLLHGAPGHHGRKGRLYKTGDLVRYSSDGSLVFIGRKDAQVKIRGQRVELGEIENCLRDSVPNLKDVVVEVIPRHDGVPSNDRLVAFLSFTLPCDTRGDGYADRLPENSKLSFNARLVDLPEQVEDVLSASLPGYMIPTAYFAVDCIPTTHSGKTDRRLLREMGSSFTATQIAESFKINSGLRRAPLTEIERLLHQIWAQVLGIESQVIGVNNSFFRLGGDSILAMRISAIARTEGINISTGDIFAEKTIAKLAVAARVQESKDESSMSPTFSSQEDILNFYNRLPSHVEVFSLDSIEDVLPCTAIQERMLEARAKNPRLYVTELGLEIRAKGNNSVNFQRIQQAWQTVVRRHSLLRAVFVRGYPKAGGSFQVVLKDPIPGISLLRREFRRSASNKQFMDASFHESGLQHHLSVYQTDETRAYLRFEFNHALADGQAIDILVRDFQLAYDNRLESNCPPYSSFLKYTMVQSHEQGRHHWSGYTDGIEPCFLPASTQTTNNARGTFSIDVTGLDAQTITKFCAEREVSIANILQVAWAIVLRHWTGSRAPCFGNIVSARDAPVDGVDEMMGPLFYLMPSQVRLHDDHTIIDILRNAREEFVQNVRHQAYSVAQLWQDLRARGSDNMFNTALSIARHTKELQETSDGHSFDVIDNSDPVEYAVYIRGALSDECVYISLEFWEEHTSRADGGKIATELGKAVSLAVSHPEWDIGSLMGELFAE
ncbi:NRPS [Trichoderma virens FT-333]|nr:NRPS [Trichoderma virens FT-333]